MPAAGKFVALVPGEDAPLYPLEMPPSLREAVREKVARAQIDSLFEASLADHELRVAPADADGKTAALVVSAERARQWRSRLAATGSRLVAILPDYLALGFDEDSWTLQCEPGANGPRILARLSQSNGFSAPLAYAVAQLRAALAAGPRPKRVSIIGDLPEPLAALFDDAGVEIEAARSDANTLSGFAGGEMAFNLRRDDAAMRAELRVTLRRWMWPVLAMMLGLVALAMALWIEGARLQNAAAKTRADAAAIARDVFLFDAPILDLRQQVGTVIAARQLRSSETAAQAGPLDLIRRGAEILTRDGVTVTRVRQEADAAWVDVAVPDFTRLEQIVRDLRQGDLDVRVLSSEAAAGTGVTAVIEISRVTSGGTR